MRRSVSILLLLFLAASALTVLPAARAQGSPQTSVSSQYIVNRYGYAVVNETVRLRNNGSSPIQVPDMQFGVGNLSSLVASFSVVGSGYSVSNSSGSQGEVYTVSGGSTTLAAGANSSFSFKVVLNGVAKAVNSTLYLDVLERPYLGFGTVSEKLGILMPASTELKSSPPGYKLTVAGTNVSYSQVLNETAQQQALAQSLEIGQTSSMDFHPLIVRSASRQIMASPDGTPLVKDSITLQNLGTTELDTLTVAPLTTADGEITVVPSTSPPVIVATSVFLSSRGIDLTNNAISLPIDPGANFTITYQYPLAKQYYNVTGGVVSVDVPLAPPISAFVNSYSIGLSLPPGIRAVQGQAKTLTAPSPFVTGTTSFTYSLSVGWAVDGAVPAASSLFVIALIGLFAARTRMAPAEEEEEEETATERSTDMVKAFEEKTSLINSMFDEIPKTEPSQLGKAYFDELRSRLDTFRSRALQRLNEMKQKSTTQKFFDLLGQIHETEREVDRAAKDMLNLYEQFYTKRMRQEVFERLLPNYKRRLEKALDKLSDELNTAQRESKLL